MSLCYNLHQHAIVPPAAPEELCGSLISSAVDDIRPQGAKVARDFIW